MVETRKNVLVLGAGLAGLSAGIYALKAGYDVTLIEKQDYVGGLCTTWKRKNCTIDGCIHWLTGYKSDKIHEVYEDLGLYDEKDLYSPSYFYSFRFEGKEIKIYRDLDKFEEELLFFAQEEDKELMKKFVSACKTMATFPIYKGKPDAMMTMADGLAYKAEIMPCFHTYIRLLSKTLESFADKIKTPFLKRFFLSFMPKNFDFAYFAAVIGKISNGNADLTRLSSKEFAQKAEQKFLSLGGKILYNTEITGLEIDEETKKITSVKDSNGNTYSAGDIISTIPLPTFYAKLLPEEYQNPEVMKTIDDPNTPFLSSFICAFRLDEDYSGEIPHSVSYGSEGRFSLAVSSADHILVQGYPYMRNPDGSVTLVVMVDQDKDDFDYWMKARENGNYASKKEVAVKKIEEILLSQQNDYQGHLSFLDASTPYTFYRYSGTYCGSFLSNLDTPDGHRKELPYQEKSLKNLYYAGQWLKGIGGIPSALETGKYAVMTLEKNNRK